MISIQQIAYIIKIVDAGNFSRAAEQCFVTQPTLSMQIKKAEELLGFAIFHRDSPKLELTAFGQALLPVLRQIQGDFGTIARLTEEFSGTFKERIRIGIIPTITAYMLQDCFAEWQQLVPDTQLTIEEMKTEELLEGLEKRKIDLAILAGPIDSTSWRSVPLFNEEILAYAPSHKKSTITVEELAEMKPWLLSKGNCLRTQMMHFCSLSEENASAWNYAGGNMDMLMRMVDSNGGYTLVPSNCRSAFPGLKKSFKQITDAAGQSPGRSIIGVSAYRHANWNSMEKMLRSLQLKYASENRKELELLNWH